MIAWCRRFTRNCQIKDREKSPRLTNEELNSARTSILAAIQRDSYASTLEVFHRDKLLPLSTSLFSLNPLLDKDGLLRVGGRLQNSEKSETSTHPIILDRHSPVVRLLLRQLHQKANHAGPTTLLALIAEEFYILGVKKLIRSISRSCIISQRTYLRTASQQMGQ